VGVIEKKPSVVEGSFSGAKDGIRTRDPDLGKVVLYQLSYFRIYTGVQRYKNFKKKIKYFYLFSSFLISFSFIRASTGVSVLISMFRMSSFIWIRRGSSSWMKLSCTPDTGSRFHDPG
jgi:hypothetical protein